MYPVTYKYTKDHEWIHVEGNSATVGITDYAQHELGEVVFVELPQVGTELAAHDVLGSVESVKAVSDIYAPVSGVVAQVNEKLEETPELINKEPHDAGWLIKVTLTDDSELTNLMDSTAYEKYLSEQAG
ncbi:glycine cleavage system protein GcvH [bacterium]|nr:glycine cleavage system protein GcvH [bacterium]